MSEEGPPKQRDDLNDGLFVINPNNSAPGNTVTLAVHIATSWPRDKDFFFEDWEGGLGIWIDWNYDDTFDPTEEVFNSIIDLPLDINGEKFPQGLVSVDVTVPNGFTKELITKDGKTIGWRIPPVRARVGYGERPYGPMQPGGRESFGEVEVLDHLGSENELTFAEPSGGGDELVATSQERPATLRVRAGEDYALVRYGVDRAITSSSGLRKATYSDPAIFFASPDEWDEPVAK